MKTKKHIENTKKLDNGLKDMLKQSTNQFRIMQIGQNWDCNKKAEQENKLLWNKKCQEVDLKDYRVD